MSKGFNMIGWRLGLVCGHPKIVQAYADVKDNSDSGQFMAIQHAAAAALRTPEIPKDVCTKYRRRLTKLVAALAKGRLPVPDAGRNVFPLREVARSPRPGGSSRPPRTHRSS